jgi:hypothetical protein
VDPVGGSQVGRLQDPAPIARRIAHWSHELLLKLYDMQRRQICLPAVMKSCLVDRSRR